MPVTISRYSIGKRQGGALNQPGSQGGHDQDPGDQAEGGVQFQPGLLGLEQWIKAKSDGSGPLRYGKLQVAQAAQVQPGPAWAAHQPQQDLVAGGTADDHAGSVVEDPRLGHGSSACAVAAAPDGSDDVEREHVIEGAAKPSAVGPHGRSGHRYPHQLPIGPMPGSALGTWPRR